MEQSEGKFQQYLEIIIRKKLLVIIPAVLLTVIAALISLRMTPYYRSSTMILVEKQQVPEAYVTPTDRTPFSERLNTIRQQIMSRQNLTKVISDFNLYENASKPGLVAKIKDFLGFQSRKTPLKEPIYERMVKAIDISVIGGRAGDAFSISYTGTDPYVTMQVTNTLASLFIEENLKVREQYAEGTSEFLSDELKKNKKDLENQERSLRNFKERHMGALPEQLETNLRTLDRLQTEMQSLSFELKNANDRKTEIEGRLNMAGGVQEGGAINPLLEEQYRLTRELTSLRTRYKDNYPDIILAKKRLAEIKKQLTMSKEKKDDREDADLLKVNLQERNPELYQDLLAAQTRLQTLKQRADEIRKQITEYERRVEQTPANEQKLTTLRRGYDISLRNYQALLEKKLNSRLAENLEKRQKGERFRVIDPPNLPEIPIKPNKVKITLMGTIAGTGMGLGFIFLLEFINPVFRKPEELEDTLKLPVLATIPDYSVKS